MAAIDQPVTTYSDTTAQKRVISNYIFNIDPMDTPVVAHFGLNSANTKFRIDSSLKGTRIELLEDTFAVLSSTANNGTTITTSTLSITVADASLFQDGYVVKIDSEIAVVTAVNTSSNTITFTSRTFGGTNATHTATVAISIVGMARKEGDDADYVGLTTLGNPYNYTAIYQKGIQVTGTEDVISQYGKPSGEWQYQANKTIPELTRLIERAFFYGIRNAGSGLTIGRSFGGIKTFVTSNSASISTTLTKASLETVAAAIFADGGVPDVLIMGPNAAGTLHTLSDTSSYVRTTIETTTFGQRPVSRVNTQFFADLKILVSRHCPANEVYMLDSRKVGFYTLRPFYEHMLSVDGDSKKGEVVGEFSLLAANGGLGHGYVTTSAASL